MKHNGYTYEYEPQTIEEMEQTAEQIELEQHEDYFEDEWKRQESEFGSPEWFANVPELEF